MLPRPGYLLGRGARLDTEKGEHGQCASVTVVARHSRKKCFKIAATWRHRRARTERLGDMRLPVFWSWHSAALWIGASCCAQWR